MKRMEEAATEQAEWDRVKTRLKQEFGESAFKSWVTPITAATVRDGEVELSVPTRFMRDWITTHYAERIRALWNGENPSVRKVTLKVEAARNAAAEAAALAAAQAAAPKQAFGQRAMTVPGARVAPRPMAAAVQNLNTPLGADLSAPLDARYVF
ncbi:MAG: chromosomal replication initiator protein DnaA, partial [Rhodospirillaceae bacterium]|nr:chromosomal replication initiator protein DnaA [Rhodospirillaceae bacterium]